MKKIFVLIFILFLNVNVYAGVAEKVGADINSFYYIPLREVFEGSLYDVSYDNQTKKIGVSLNDDTYTFSVADDYFTKNDTQYKLNYPLASTGGKTYIHYDDVSYLFTSGDDIHKDTKKEIVSLIYFLKQNYLIPGVAISFVDKQNNYLWSQGFGYSDKELAIPVTTDTLFNVASISKTFTTLGIFSLQDRGLLDLDAPITNYLPEFSLKQNPIYGGDSNEVTVRMLLSHFSGINGDIFNGFYTYNEFDKDYMNNYISNIRREYMTSDSGTRQSYSNSGFAVLGNIVSVLSGNQDTFDGYINEIDKQILTPIGMKNSGFNLTETTTSEMSKSYADSLSQRAQALYVNNISAGGFYSNANDMSKFLTFMLNKGTISGQTVIQQQSIEQMISPVSYTDPFSSFVQGLGTYITTYNGNAYVGHGGDVNYFHSDYQISFENDLAMFVTCNSASSAGVAPFITLLTLDEVISNRGANEIKITNYEPSFESDDVSIETEEAAIQEQQIMDINEFKGYYIGLGYLEILEDSMIKFKDVDYIFKHVSDTTYANDDIGLIKFTHVDGMDVIVTQGIVWTQKVEVEQADDNFLNITGKYKAITKPNELQLMDEIELVTDADGIPLITITVNDYSAASSSLPLTKADDNLYVILGVGRNLSNVIELVEYDTKLCVKYNGVIYTKITQ